MSQNHRHHTIKPFLLLLLSFLLAMPVFTPVSDVHATIAPVSGLEVKDMTDGVTAASLVAKILGSGVEARKIGGGPLDASVFRGAPGAVGTFKNGGPVFGVSDGIVLSTGRAKDIIGPNETNGKSTMNNTAGDADLASLVGVPINETFDAAVLEFEFKLANESSSEVVFKFVLASEEYPEYLDYFDTMGLYINDKNVALVPESNPPRAVSVGTVNSSTNSSLYVANATGTKPETFFNTEMDGFTTVITARSQIVPNTWNKIKLAVADKGDMAYDTNVMIEAESLQAPGGLEATEINKDNFLLSWDPVTGLSDISAYDVYMDGAFIGSSISNSYFVKDLKEYTLYKMSVRSKDTDGNFSPTSDPLDVRTADATPPSAVENISVSEKTDSSFTLSWLAAKDSGSGIDHYDIFNNGVKLGETSDLTYAVSGLEEYSDNSITIIAVDKYGNSTPTSILVKTRDGQKPSAPVISPVPPTIIGTDHISLTWLASVDNPGGSGIDHYGVLVNGTIVGKTANLAYGLTGLLPATSYTLTIVAYDKSGNESDPSEAVEVSTLTSPQLDTVAPTRPGTLTASARTATGFRVAWIASVDNGTPKSGLAGYEVFINDVLHGVALPVTSPGYTASGLLPETTYEVKVRAVDKAGNKSAFQPIPSLKVTTTKDLTAPSVPSGLVATEKTGTSFILNWTASTDNIGVTRYEVYKDGALEGNAETTSLLISNLTTGLTYKMTVRAVDAAGNKSAASAVLEVTTNADNVPPTSPTGLAMTDATSSSFVLGWEAATDNVAVTSYDVYRDGNKVGTVTNGDLFLEITGLAKDTVYSMTVVAKDAAGNQSPPSKALAAKTSANSEPPLPPEDLIAFAILDTSFILDWAPAEDDYGIQRYDIYANGIKIKSVNHPITQTIIGDTANGDLPLVKGTTYIMSIKSVDTDDNESEFSDELPVLAENSNSGPNIVIQRVKGSVTNTAASIRFLIGQTIKTDENPTPPSITEAWMRVDLKDKNGSNKFSVYRTTGKGDKLKVDGKYKTASIPVSGANITDGSYYAYLIATHPTNPALKTVLLRSIKVDKSAPKVTNVNKSSDIYSPNGSLTAAVQYTLDESAKITVQITNSTGSLVKTLSTNVNKTKGSHTVNWNGRDRRNLLVADGTYNVIITAKNQVGLTTTIKSLKIIVESKKPTITKVKITPSPYRTTTFTKTTISFALSEKAKVSVRVLDLEENIVRNVVTESVRNPGTVLIDWNGKNNSAANVPDGLYRILLDAVDIPPAEGDIKPPVALAPKTAATYEGLLVLDGRNNPLITNITTSPESFVADGTAVLTVSYKLSENSSVNIDILNSSSAVVRTISTKLSRFAGTRTFSWNGKANSGTVVSPGTYTIRIMAVDSGGKSGTATSPVTLSAP
jgi:chitodextrinase/flagellar hook assembly protein FlgD